VLSWIKNKLIRDTGRANSKDSEERRKIILEIFEDSKLNITDLSVIDLVDALHFKVTEGINRPIRYPPPHIRKVVQNNMSVFGYGGIGSQFAGLIKLLCEVKSQNKILDFGCGGGRVASWFYDYIKNPGQLYGLDVVPEVIHYAKKIMPKFEFTYMNVFSENYNRDPKAVKPEHVRFPYNNEFFDVTYLVSVFTHMIPPKIQNYVKEISRVLKEGGRCFVTFFLLQNNSEYLKEGWEQKFVISDLHSLKTNDGKDSFRVGNKNNPEDWVIYDLDYIISLFRKHDMELVHGPFFGNWNNYPDWLTSQDILVFKKTKLVL